MKKKQIVLTLLIALIITLSTTASSYASTSPPMTRLAGQTRYDTASAIAKQGWTQSDYAILAFGENFPDALSSAPLAKKYNAPILLTNTSNLPDVTKQTLIDLKVKEVFIIGGTGVVSTSVESELQSMEINSTRIAGIDRYETSIKIAQQIAETPSTLFVVTGEDYPDALSVAPIAGIKQIPIILVPKNSLPDSVKKYISSVNVTKTYVIGYSDVIKDTVTKQLSKPERILGTDKYARNITINMKFNDSFTNNGTCVVSGEGFADALTGVAYASIKSLPIVFVKNASPVATKDYYHSRNSDGSSVYVFGGAAVVPDSLIQDLNNTTPNPTQPTEPTTGTKLAEEMKRHSDAVQALNLDYLRLKSQLYTLISKISTLPSSPETQLQLNNVEEQLKNAENDFNQKVKTENDLHIENMSKISVENSKSDTTPPVLNRVQMTSPKVVSVGDKVTIKASISDDKSGVLKGSLQFYSPSGNSWRDINLSYDSNLKGWTGSYTIEPTNEKGIWVLHNMYIEDTAGNYKIVYKINLPRADILDFTVN